MVEVDEGAAPVITSSDTGLDATACSCARWRCTEDAPFESTDGSRVTSGRRCCSGAGGARGLGARLGELDEKSRKRARITEVVRLPGRSALGLLFTLSGLETTGAWARSTFEDTWLWRGPAAAELGAGAEISLISDVASVLDVMFIAPNRVSSDSLKSTGNRAKRIAYNPIVMILQDNTERCPKTTCELTAYWSPQMRGQVQTSSDSNRQSDQVSELHVC